MGLSASAMPQTSACIGSSELALTSSANCPASRARPIQASNSATLRMVRYFLRSTGVLRASSARAAASACGVPFRLDVLSLRSPGLLEGARPFGKAGFWSANRSPLRSEACALPDSSTFSASGSGENTPALAATFAGSTCEYSPTRRVRVENSIAFRKAISLRASGSCTARSSSGTSSLTLSSSNTSCREMRAFSAFSIKASRRFGCLISPARFSSVSRSPYSTISCAAVLMPMPGTPGTLSVESPASACTSTTFSGGTPNFSITSGIPMRRSFMVSNIVTLSVTSCIKSLSEETIVVVAPRSPASFA